MTSRWAWAAGAALALPAAVAGVAAVGQRRWQRRTGALLARLTAARADAGPPRVDLQRLDALPSPVRRCLRTVLTDGVPAVTAVAIEQCGEMNLSEGGARWRPFTAQHHVITQRPGFVWDARVNLLPGVAVHVHDAYVDGAGLLRPAIAGCIALADLHGEPELNAGELMRFLAESVWYPGVWLDPCVQWQPLSGHEARATLTDGAVQASLTFAFDDSGLVRSCRADARARRAGTRWIGTPWEGRWSTYQRRDGLCVPMAGEVAWLLPSGRHPYWRGTVTSLRYKFASCVAAQAERERAGIA